MTFRHAAALALVCYFAFSPLKVSAYCPGNDPTVPDYDPHYYSVPKEFGRAKYVVEVRVLRETWLGDDGKVKLLKPPFQDGARRPWGFDPYIGAYYDVKVLQVFKGALKPELRLFSDNSTSRFWLDVGSDYLLFISDDTFDPPIGVQLTTDNCGNSAGIKDARATVRTLEALSRSKREGSSSGAEVHAVPRKALASGIIRGWLVMLPPLINIGSTICPQTRIDDAAPLSKWSKVRRYDTESECAKSMTDWKQEQAGMFQLAERTYRITREAAAKGDQEALDWVRTQDECIRQRHFDPNHQMTAQVYTGDGHLVEHDLWYIPDICVATDDPRLKEK